MVDKAPKMATLAENLAQENSFFFINFEYKITKTIVATRDAPRTIHEICSFVSSIK